MLRKPGFPCFLTSAEVGSSGAFKLVPLWR